MAKEKNKMAKDLNRHPTKEDIPMAKCIWKDIQHHMSLEKCKLKQWDTTRLLTEWPKSRALTTPNADKDLEQQELSHIAGWHAKQYDHFENCLVFSYKINVYDPTIVILDVFSKEKEI